MDADDDDEDDAVSDGSRLDVRSGVWRGQETASKPLQLPVASQPSMNHTRDTWSYSIAREVTMTTGSSENGACNNLSRVNLSGARFSKNRKIVVTQLRQNTIVNSS